MANVAKTCPTCGKDFSGHPNKRFCRPVCKDRYHNAQPHRIERTRQFNPRPVHYCDTCAEHGIETLAKWSGASMTHESGREYLCEEHAITWAHPMSDDAVQGAF